MSRRKFRSKFKSKVVLESLKERCSLVDLVEKYQIHPIQISVWKCDFLNNAEQVFEFGTKDKRSEADKEKDGLLKTIGELKVENDFLKNVFR